MTIHPRLELPFEAGVVGSLPEEQTAEWTVAARGSRMDASVAYAIALQETAGIDVVSDGEWRRYAYTNIVGDIAEGFHAVRSDGKLWAMTALMFGVGIFVIGAFLVVLPIVNRDVYGFGSDGIRDMFVTFWMGAFVSSVVLSIFKRIKRQGRLLLIAQFLASVSILAMMWQVPHYVFLGIVFIWGLAAGISIAMSRSIVQDAAPKEKLARVLSIYQLGFMAGAPFGAAIMGALVDLFGPQKIAIVPAGGMIALIIWMVFFTPVWNMKGSAWLEHQERS